MTYKNYLKNKNLSANTIRVYLLNLNKWEKYIDGRKINKTIYLKYLKSFFNTHQPNSIRLIHSSLISYFKYLKLYKLINEVKDIRLPKIHRINRKIININMFNEVKRTISFNNWYTKRDWIIFSFLFLTGVRVSELLEFNKNSIYDKNKLKLVGKGNKTRLIILNNYLVELLNSWKYNKLAISKSNKLLSYKQILIIVKNIIKKYFNKELTPHDLRRSFATNLLKSSTNIEIVRLVLGHSNINTTARYLQFGEDDIEEELNKFIIDN